VWCRLLFSAILILVSPHIAVVQQDQKTCQVIVIQKFISPLFFHMYSCVVIEHIDNQHSQFYILCFSFPIAVRDFCMCRHWSWSTFAVFLCVVFGCTGSLKTIQE
jgi:hypothetical protein